MRINSCKLKMLVWGDAFVGNPIVGENAPTTRILFCSIFINIDVFLKAAKCSFEGDAFVSIPGVGEKHLQQGY